MRISKGVKVVAMNDQMQSAAGLNGMSYIGLRTVQPGDRGVITAVSHDGVVEIDFDCSDGSHGYVCTREVVEACCKEA